MDSNMNEENKNNENSEISDSITSTIANAEHSIGVLIEKSQEKAREDAEQALVEYRAQIEQISTDIMKNISEGSIRISESINQAIKRKVEKESSGLTDAFMADSIKKAEEASASSPHRKDVNKIDYELAKAAAELKDKTSKLNKTAEVDSVSEPKNNGKKSSDELKNAGPESTQEVQPAKGDEKVEDIIQFFS